MLRKLLLLCLVLAATAAHAQKRVVTMDEIYDPARRIEFAGVAQANIQWIDDTRLLWAITGSNLGVTEVLEVNATNGRTKPFFDTSKLQALLQKEAGATEAEARAITRQKRYPLARAGRVILVSAKNDLFTYDRVANRLTRLTSTPAREEEFDFSPDGSNVSFIRGNDIYTVAASGTKPERRLTFDGSDDVLNGVLDWVYQEEIYGRGEFRGTWWSPDSKSIAFLRLDETRVPRHAIVDDIPYEQRVTMQRYPKAGEPNPLPKIMVVDAAGGESRDLTLGSYDAADLLVVNVSWTPDSSRVVYQATNREQTWLDLVTADRVTRNPRTILRETSPAWVKVIAPPRWISGETFLWLSERSGLRHLYLVGGNGAVVRQVTAGEWEVRDVGGFDAKGSWIYLTANEREAIGQDVYRVHPDGTGLARISDRRGTHSPKFNQAATRYSDSWSDFSTPPQLRVHRADGGEVAVLDRNPSHALEQLVLSRPEFLQVKTRDGFSMEAVMLRPADFDPAKKYPVFQYLYGGPHAPVVENAWSGTTYLFHQAIAQSGIIVWMCDNRSASGKSAASAWTSYKKFGEQELRDLEDGAAWLKRKPWIDGDRFMLYGWSFGGFMTSYALTHSTTFSAGIAGAPVTDWRDYDSVYTERYMLTPGRNANGYRDASPRFAAGNLHGDLLLIHGAMDDNVHFQNSVQFVFELQKAGKSFRTMVYPKTPHGVTWPALVAHLRRMMFEFVMENLKR